MVLGGAAVRT